jgi:glycosyltransferase 2 family protein
MVDVNTSKSSKRIFMLIRIAVVICGLALGILWLSGADRWSTLVKIFHQMNKGVFVSVLFFYIVIQAILGVRWWLLLRAQSIFICFWAVVKLSFLGLFYNNFMPGSVGGDLMKAWYVTRHTDRKFQAVLSVFVDRVIIGLSATFLISVFSYIFFLRNEITLVDLGSQLHFRDLTEGERKVITSLLILILIIIIAFLSAPKGRSVLRKVLFYIQTFSRRIFKKLKDTAVIYLKKPFVILEALGLTVLLQLLAITGFWFLGRSMGVNTGIAYYYFIFALTWVLGAIPVSVGGAVVVEGLLAYLFVVCCGVQPESALALALSQRLIWMLSSLPGAIIHIFGAHLPKDFFIDYNGLVA